MPQLPEKLCCQTQVWNCYSDHKSSLRSLV
uniref:Uncharacterized protein n=1 Tax=Arundo donax TaxID=35708 RepID=A0A0A8YTT7_ARUDO